jgi:hypothetical protein
LDERVADLRAAGHSWLAIARRLRGTVGSARRALLCGENGCPQDEAPLRRNSSP